MFSIKTSKGSVSFNRFVGPFINNKFHPTLASTPVKRQILNPCTEDLIETVQEASAEDVDLAVQSAQAALKGPWKHFSGKKRRNALLDIAHALEKNLWKMTVLEAACGKPLEEAKFDIEESIECFRYFAGHADKISGSNFATEGGHKSYTVRKPVGICGLITSFNYPLNLAAWKIAPALACGNAVILKPAPQTPLSSLMLGELIAEHTELPAGVFSVLPGGEDVGSAIVSHKGIHKVSFTGSGNVGRKVMGGAANSNLKSVILELGGKSPLIVFKDADLDQAVEDVFGAIFSNMGQNCCAGSRLFLESGIEDEFLSKLKDRVKQVKIGDTLDEAYDFGTMVDRVQFERVMGFIENAKKEGKSKLLVGGNRHGEKGYFIEPTVFTDVDETSTLAKDEIFGPVLSVMKPFKTIEEALERANATPYGLASGVWTKDLSKSEQCIQELETGVTWVNCYNMCSVHLPFGGVKQSGFGKDLGAEAMGEYLTVKAVTIRV
ncbi:aldehyde dehydrogenase domain-containing protein [Gamsiella multidivaricata]|uniref:aldehyde dehydrogenase domain-containing protein n=1 Tax=Gamsiella multidivaricata TaxID=101098 RepID=UPI00221F3007|nr:aldehyde dehydrogenase domain-containing protein [Gamsiella multidivaricata]KAG0368888.1 Aldehyde dehydrogenase [Gamsiella multidivaricata]KAI7816194.1 aldehyde dehydrogenase domain-containing protein [Gamsiella multidivaricata]